MRVVTGILQAFFRSSGASSSRSSGGDGAGWSPPGLAIEPYGERSRSIYIAGTEKGHRITRSAELAMSGWYAPRPRLYAHALDLRGWLGPVVFHGGWTRYHEPGAMTLDTLDLFRARIGLNVLAGSSRAAELTPLVGVLALRGNDVTPAFDAGADLRVYPIRPLVVAASFQVAFFKDGPPFLETRLEPGISISRLDLRVGAMWVHQARAISSIGPSATIAVRW